MEYYNYEASWTPLQGVCRPVGAPIKHRLSLRYPATLSAGWSELYPYTADLLAFESCHPAHEHTHRKLMQISTSLRPHAWDKALAQHPNWAFAAYICNGIHQGLRIGFDCSHPLRSALHNMPLHPALPQPDLRIPGEGTGPRAHDRPPAPHLAPSPPHPEDRITVGHPVTFLSICGSDWSNNSLDCTIDSQVNVYIASSFSSNGSVV